MTKPRKSNDGFRDDRRRVIVTTSRGWRVECLPVQPMLDELGTAESHPDMPPIPTYVVTDVSGATVEQRYTAEIVASDDTPEEDRLAWQRREEKLAEVRAELSERRLRVIGTRGVKVLDMPADEKWIPEHEWLYGSVPENPFERRYHFFKTEVIGTAEDGMVLAAGIYRASGVDEEVITLIEDSFRASMGGQTGTDTAPDTEDTGEEGPQETGGLVVEPNLDDD